MNIKLVSFKKKMVGGVMYISRKMPETLLLSLPPAVMPYAISRKFSSA